MGRKKKQLPQLFDIKVTDVAAEGNAICRVKLNGEDSDPLVVFVPFGAPGDIVDLKIDRLKKKYAEGHITRIVTPSDKRTEPMCSYFGVCGGCRWQHIPYSEQLKTKRRNVIDNMERIGKVTFPEVPETLPSERQSHYRNKMEYTFSNKRWKSWEEMRGEIQVDEGDNALGFHIPGSFDKVLHIKCCPLQNEIGDSIRTFIYKYALDNHYGFYDIKNNNGLLRTMMIRIADTGEIMVCLVFGEDDKEKINKILEALKVNFPEITSLLYVINTKLNDTISDQKIHLFSGRDHIVEKMGELKFKISAKSFYQTNSRQAQRLYETVASFAGLTHDKTDKKKGFPLVYDLYTGTGTIANFIAGNSAKVIGIEYVEDAIADAKVNSLINNISNTEFYAGDMKKVLTDEFISVHGRPDILILDPPRAGVDEDVLKVIINANPEVIVYVSCNPSTQARDLSILDPHYKITGVQPVDMFPHTHHVENVVRLERRK